MLRTIPFLHSGIADIATILSKTVTNVSPKNTMLSKLGKHPKIIIIKGVVAVAEEEVVEAVEGDTIRKQRTWLMQMQMQMVIIALPPRMQYSVVLHTAAKRQSTVVFEK